MSLTHVDAGIVIDNKTPQLLFYSYRGVSTDTKPTTLPNSTTAIPTGSEFYERDTKQWFDWSGTSWVFRIPKEDPTLLAIQQVVDATNKVHRELVALRMGFIEKEMCSEITDTDLNSATAAGS